jgi:peptidoglycan-associated lipoprotein
MKICVTSLTPLLFLAMLSYTGCAKQELVRKDDSVAPSLSSAKQVDSTAAAAKPVAPTAQTTEKTPLVPANTAPAPVREQTIAAKSSDSAANAAEVQRQLEKVYFAFDSAALSDSARGTITANAAVITRNPGLKVRVEGHCDERGSDEYNLAIGERRAKAAAQYLKSLGVGAERITTLSFGKEKPVDPGHDEAAWSKNRRDEFIVVR